MPPVDDGGLVQNSRVPVCPPMGTDQAAASSSSDGINVPGGSPPFCRGAPDPPAAKRPTEDSGERCVKPRHESGASSSQNMDDDGDVRIEQVVLEPLINNIVLYYDTIEQHHHAYLDALSTGVVTEVYSPPRVTKHVGKHGL
jgi:hypothetical protein